MSEEEWVTVWSHELGTTVCVPLHKAYEIVLPPQRSRQIAEAQFAKVRADMRERYSADSTHHRENVVMSTHGQHWDDLGRAIEGEA